MINDACQVVNTSLEQTIRNFFSTRSGQDDVRNGLTKLYPRVWRFALALSADRSVADDLAQATAIRALENADKFKPGTHLDRWLFTIARRIWLNEKRAEAVRRAGGLVPVEEIDVPADSPETETNILAREVLNQIMALPEAQRATVLLVYVEGYAYREAADLLDIPVGTVMSRLAAARKSIVTAQDNRRRSTF